MVTMAATMLAVCDADDVWCWRWPARQEAESGSKEIDPKNKMKRGIKLVYVGPKLHWGGTGRGEARGPEWVAFATLCRAGDRMGRVCNLRNTLSGRWQIEYASLAILLWNGDRNDVIVPRSAELVGDRNDVGPPRSVELVGDRNSVSKEIEPKTKNKTLIMTIGRK
jgi:hypothetical protein